MAKRPEKYDANMPRNLTYRQREKTYYWRNPITRQEYSLGRIARRDAISQAIQANNYVDSNFLPVALLERLATSKQEKLTLGKWLVSYNALLLKRDLKPGTMKLRTNQMSTVTKSLGALPLAEITTKEIARFLNHYVETGKNSMAAGLRSLLSDVFREAIADGHISINPVTPTRAPSITVKRERLTSVTFDKIRETARTMEPWIVNSMELALITGQRRDDIRLLKKTDIFENRLRVIQGKTGERLAIPLTLRLAAYDMTLGEVIERCLQNNNTEFILSSASRKTGRQPGALRADSITQAFWRAVKKSGVSQSETPPSFHEIRSLASRLYEREYGAEFAQKLLGHKSMKMTNVYLDSRGTEWTEI